MLAALRDRAEDLARKLEFIRLKQEPAKNERFSADNQDLLPFAVEVTLPPRDPEIEAADHPANDTAHGGAKPTQPANRRRRARDDASKAHQTVHVPIKPARCPQCQAELRVVGTTSSGRYDWIPGHFVVLDVEREQSACPNCPSVGSYAASEPFLLPRALCGNGLLARVIVDKFADHIPLNRQVGRMEREDFDVASSTLSDWVAKGAEQVRPLISAVRKEILSNRAVLGDDTGLPVQDGSDGTLRKGRLWVFTDQEQAFYAFTDTKEGEHPAKLLEGIRAQILLVDGGSEFNRAVEKYGLGRGGCWSHLRRYFFDARLQHEQAVIPLIAIRDLFLIERQIVGSTADDRKKIRLARSKPIVDAIYTWVRQVSTTVRPRSVFGDALTYAQNQESRLRLFLEHGELPLHNNLSELLLRQPVVGRKNWLFARSEGGAEAAAAWFTLVGSCMLQAIDPWTYLLDVFRRLPDHPANRVHELTPRAWRVALEEPAPKPP
jgi:transposase